MCTLGKPGISVVRTHVLVHAVVVGNESRLVEIFISKTVNLSRRSIFTAACRLLSLGCEPELTTRPSINRRTSIFSPTKFLLSLSGRACSDDLEDDAIEIKVILNCERVVLSSRCRMNDNHKLSIDYCIFFHLFPYPVGYISGVAFVALQLVGVEVFFSKNWDMTGILLQGPRCFHEVQTKVQGQASTPKAIYA